MTTPVLFDRKLLLARRRRALQLGAETFLLDRVAEELVERLGAVKRNFDLALDLGTPGDTLARLLGNSGQVAKVETSDLFAGDEEVFAPGDAKFDLVVSALALQWVNDLPGALVQIRRALKPDGLLLAALVGGETLHELRESLAAAEAEITGGASRASRRSPKCAASARSCSARVMRCPSSTATATPCVTKRRSSCFRICAAWARPMR